MDVWGINMTETKPILMTHTVLPKNEISHDIYSNKQYSL